MGLVPPDETALPTRRLESVALAEDAAVVVVVTGFATREAFAVFGVIFEIMGVAMRAFDDAGVIAALVVAGLAVAEDATFPSGRTVIGAEYDRFTTNTLNITKDVKILFLNMWFLPLLVLH